MEVIDKEILEKAIEIAVENGWVMPVGLAMCGGDMKTVCDIPRFRLWREFFSHDFAKAFWGDIKLSDFIQIKARKGRVLPFNAETMKIDYIWQYHLQQMVLEDNPIDYLRKFIDNAE